MFRLYEDFEVEFKAVFREIDKKRIVERQLIKFKQTVSASYYTVQFQQIILRLHWKDDILIIRFYEDLKEYIKDKIVKEDRSKELIKYIEYIIRIDDVRNKKEVIQRSRMWNGSRCESGALKTSGAKISGRCRNDESVLAL